VVEYSDRSDETETTGYSRDALESAYGEVSIELDTFAVSEEKYERMRESKARDAIGGARVLLGRSENGSETLLVSNRGDAGWDIPGGAREPGELPETTARREVREEVGLDVELRDALQAYDWGFVPESGEAERVAGLWVHFEGVARGDDTAVTVQEEELEAARWFDAQPDRVDPPVESIVSAFFASAE